MARPAKVSADTVARLTDAIRAGNYYEAACAYARISYSTMRNWITRAEEERVHIAAGGRPRKGEAEFLEFLEALEKAEADAEVRLVAQWQQHAPLSWQACRDFLARRFPERWGANLKLQANMEHEVHFSEEEVAARREMLRDLLRTREAGRDPEAPADPLHRRGARNRSRDPEVDGG